MTDRNECLCGRPLRPCPCGWDWCTTCDPGDGETLEQRITDAKAHDCGMSQQ